MYPQYYAQYHTDLFHHYETLPYVFFWWNIFSLDGKYGEIVQLRQKWIDGVKLEKEERKMLRKVMTEDMERYRDERFKEQTVANAEAILNNFTDSIQKKIEMKKREQAKNVT